jgi:hypothetical protein
MRGELAPFASDTRFLSLEAMVLSENYDGNLEPKGSTS